MRKVIYGITGVLIGLIIYILLSINTPNAEQISISMADSHYSPSEVPEDLSSVSGPVTTFFENGTYHLNEANFDNYEQREVVKYGKSNPMFFYKYNVPKEVEEEDNSVNNDKRQDNKDNSNEVNEDYLSEADKGETTAIDSGGKLVDSSGDYSVKGFNVETGRYEDVNIASALFDFGFTGRLPIDEEFFVLSSGFGGRKDPFTHEDGVHTGLDFSAPNIDGKNVYSASHGEVIALTTSDSGYGNHVILQHNGYTTLYGHLSSFSDIKIGDRVSAGIELGKVGNTGRSTGPHLHFEIRIGNVAIDPIVFMNEIRRAD